MYLFFYFFTYIYCTFSYFCWFGLCNILQFAFSLHFKSTYNKNLTFVYELNDLFFVIFIFQTIKSVTIEGFKENINDFMEILGDEMKCMNPESFTITTHRSNEKRCYDMNTKALVKTIEAFKNWTRLSYLNLTHIFLPGYVARILGALRNPCERICLLNNLIGFDDMVYLSQCHHLPKLYHLALEGNQIDNNVEELVELVKQTPDLKYLNLGGTHLNGAEKLEVIKTLQAFNPKLETLKLAGVHDWSCSPKDYVQQVEIACQMPALRKFFVFPWGLAIFATKMFEECDQLLKKFGRTDIELQY